MKKIITITLCFISLLAKSQGTFPVKVGFDTAAYNLHTTPYYNTKYLLNLTTTGTSGAATLTGLTLNIPNYATGGGAGAVNTVKLTTSGVLYTTPNYSTISHDTASVGITLASQGASQVFRTTTAGTPSFGLLDSSHFGAVYHSYSFLQTNPLGYALDNSVAHLAGTETISGAKTFSSLITSSISAGGNIYSATNGTDVNLIFTLTAPGAGTKFARIYSTTSTPIQLGQSTNKIGIGGISSPTSALHLPAGTATANTSPLKFTSGSLLTTPEIGAVEFLNGLLFLDSSNTKRDTIATRDWVRYQSDTLNISSTLAKRGLSGHITATGLIVPGATNQAALMGNGTTKTLISATYTPTATSVSNVTSTSSIGVFQYTRIGNILTVSGTMSVTPTAGATQTIYKISLPVAATSTTLSSVAGVASFYDASGNMVSGNIDGSNSGYATITTKSQGAGALLNGSFHFTYVIDPANP